MDGKWVRKAAMKHGRDVAGEDIDAMVE